MFYGLQNTVVKNKVFQFVRKHSNHKENNNQEDELNMEEIRD